MKDKYITIRMAAEILCASYRTVQRYISDGKIPYTKPCGKVLIKEQDLLDFINMQNR